MKEEQHNLGNNKKSGFGLPDGYFDSFDSRLMKKIEIQDELLEFPTLASLTKENPFFVDPSYFEELPPQIAERIQTGKIDFNWLEKLKTILFRPAFAFSFFIALFVTIVLVSKSKSVIKDEVCNDLACLSKEEILNSDVFGALTVEELTNEMPENTFNTNSDDTDGIELINDLIENPEFISKEVENIDLDN